MNERILLHNDLPEEFNTPEKKCDEVFAFVLLLSSFFSKYFSFSSQCTHFFLQNRGRRFSLNSW